MIAYVPNAVSRPAQSHEVEPTNTGFRGMYSETAVRMSSNQMTDEGFDQRCTLLSHLSYVPGKASGDGGTRTHNPRVKTMYSNRQSVIFWWRRRLVRVTRSQVSNASRK